MKAIEKLREVTKTLKISGIEHAEKEAEMLLRHSLDFSAIEIYRDNPELSERHIKTVERVLERRCRREPFQYITGYVDFFGQKLLVGSAVLIPRPETELMAEQAIKTVTSEQLSVNSKNNNPSLVTTRLNSPKSRHSSLIILDICTGCGCLALALAKEFPEAQVYGSDKSDAAIGYAKKNAEINGIKNVTFLTGSLFEPLEKLSNPRPEFGSKAVNCQLLTFDLIISNPPYVKTDDIQFLQPEIKDWEPVSSLDGGSDGLDFYRELIPSARHFLKNEGLLMVETGAGQSCAVTDIMESSEYKHIEIIKDYAGIERIILARWKR
ncbi:MAG: peptide chain release factor N(5)-glutamine methyltransferase [Thermodesulfovibrionia bacterium]